MRIRAIDLSTVALLIGACNLGEGTTGIGPGPAGGTIFFFASISVGGTHSCTLVTAAKAFCWGANFGGELGDATNSASAGPVRVLSSLIFGALGAGSSHTCALTTNGIAYCWGFNDFGQLGDATTESRSSPSKVVGGLVFVAVATGTNHTCALTADGVAHCWGGNSFGELGNGSDETTSVPVPVAGGLRFASVSAGGATCGLTLPGVPYCWGREWGLVPTTVPGGLVFESISTGDGHACGVTADGRAHCWGANDRGQLGIGRIDPIGFEPTPQPVATELRFRKLAAGTTHSCGIASDERAYCWGSDGGGKLGNGNDRPSGGSDSSTPVRVEMSLSFMGLSAGLNSTCGVTTDFQAWCWGLRTGNRTTMRSEVPVRVSSP